MRYTARDLEEAIDWFKRRQNQGLDDKCGRMEAIALTALRETLYDVLEWEYNVNEERDPNEVKHG